MGDDDFLARWSRRKRAVAEEEPSEPTAPESVPETEPASEDEEAELLARLNLPSPESLKEGDDFSVFMAEGVPAFLRKRALRVLWRSNPVLANLDGLNDYDEDFTSPELTQRVLATAYQVGRGFVSEKPQQPETFDVDDSAEEHVQEQESEREDPVVIAENEPVEKTLQPVEDPQPVARPRRMRFEG